MRSEPVSDPLDDPRVLQAVEEYQFAIEAGQRPDLEQFLTRHAAVADLVRECLAGLQMVHAVSPALVPPSPTEPLGDFRILREIGRGGMGIVYEAVQLSLGRRVALKVLPFAAALDPRQLQRFKNEAQAAALLHHPNIVPVHAVGCERGVHYYAMQYIEGRSLASLLHEPRDRPEPTGVKTTAAAARSTQQSGSSRERWRGVARLGVLAARALDHAHQLGIVHRDIKPGNLLLDQTGNLWVTDFGLALIQNDAGLTRSGELLGTVRYMSPEQALSRPALVDHRTDIYSLGATLYELLTSHALFEGHDRQEILRRIAFEEPIPPRRHEPALPAELETIVLKAVSKLPADRYATAGELADDLERFLEDQPIRARRPTWLERSARWARRHRPLVASAAVLLVLLALGFGLSTLLVARAYDREHLRAEEASRQRKRAEDSYQAARKAVDLLVQISEEELADKPHWQSLRRKLLEAAMLYYQDFVAQHGDDPARREELAGVRTRLASIIEDVTTLQGQHDLHVLGMREVHDILGLSHEQRERLKELRQEFPFRLPEFRDFASLSAEERRQRVVDLARLHEVAISQLLTPAQSQRLKQVALQARGAGVFLDVAVSDTLKLTPRQKEALRRALEEHGPPPVLHRPGEPPEANRRRLDRHFHEAVERALTILTPEQRRQWQSMTGDPVALPVRLPPPEPGPRPRLFP